MILIPVNVSTAVHIKMEHSKQDLTHICLEVSRGTGVVCSVQTINYDSLFVENGTLLNKYCYMVFAVFHLLQRTFIENESW